MELHIEELSDIENKDSLLDISMSPTSSLIPVLPALEEIHVHESEHMKFVNQLRERFFADVYGSGDSKRSPANHRLKRSMTERGPRKPPRDYSFDSGLSSPGSNISYDEVFQTAPRMTRHMSMDGMQMDRHKIYKSVRDLQDEAQKVQHIVEDMTSTQTMRRRRKMSAGLSIYARKLRAKHSLSLYSPIAPVEPECAQRFDEIIARLKGCEPSADEAHICEEEECDPNCEMKKLATDTNFEIQNSTNDQENYTLTPTSPDTDDVFTVEEQPPNEEISEKLLTVHDETDLARVPKNAENIPQNAVTISNIDYEDTRENPEVYLESNLIDMSNNKDAASEKSISQADIRESLEDDEGILKIETSDVYENEPRQTDFNAKIMETDSLNNIAGYENEEETKSWSAEVMEEIVTVRLASRQQGHNSIDETDQSSPVTCVPDRMCQSMVEEPVTDKTDIKSLLRSISFQKPHLLSNSTCRLRRTDSDNDVWIEREKPTQANNISSVSLSTTSKKNSRWNAFSRIFSFRSSRRPVLKS
ncbi:uncharacterized protein [Watersipora subatra]|uniref:uncharacterized protein n=1 Tax=Watersipora subatra TaxID=2589382 RepID=UPI00355BA3B9